MKASGILLLLSAVIVTCISCTSDQTVIHTDGKCRLSVCVDYGPSTRLSSSGDEDMINSIQFLLFRDGILYAAESAEEGSINIEADFGTYSLYAFVNDPQSWVSMPEVTEDDIMKATSHFSDNTSSSFVMFGSISAEIKEESASVSIPVDRFASRIIIEKLAVDFSSTSYYEGCILIIKNIYMTNVLGTCPYTRIPSDSPPSNGIWYNRMGIEDAPEEIAAMTEDIGLDISIPDGSEQTLGRIYYAYPNGCVKDSASDTWEARKCRMVIEAVLDGKECWYHITIPPMKPNASYSIDKCTIKNAGGMTPEDNTRPSCEVTITEHLLWDHTYSVEEES